MTGVLQHRLDLADADALENFYLSQTNTQTTLIQLDRGNSQLHARSTDLGDVRILNVAAEGRHLWIDNMGQSEWRFALMANADASVKIGRQRINASTAQLLRPGEDCELLTNGRYRTLEICFGKELIAKQAWNLRPGQIANVGQTHAASLVRLVDSAFRDLGTASKDDSNRDLRHKKSRWNARAVDALSNALSPWTSGNVRALGKTDDVAQRARKLLKDIDFGQRASVDLLAKELGVSRRTLFLAFQQKYEVGPRRLREIIKLNALRASLHRNTKETASITSLANKHGFSELGRLAGTYRELFGENPSQTLARHGLN